MKGRETSQVRLIKTVFELCYYFVMLIAATVWIVACVETVDRLFK